MQRPRIVAATAGASQPSPSPRIPFKVFVETLKSKKGDLIVAGFALVCLVISSGKISVKRERKQLEAEYEQRLGDLEAENSALREKIGQARERVLSEASRSGAKLSPMATRINAIFDELTPSDPPPKAMEAAKPEQQRRSSKFFV